MIHFIIQVVILPQRLMFGFLAALIGKSLYNWDDIRDHLSDEAVKKYDKFPHIVQQTLQDPFGGKRDLLWIYFGTSANSSDGMALIRRLDSRNRDLLSVITSVMISPIISSPYLSYLLSQASGDAEYEARIGVVILGIYLLSILIYVLLYSYIMLLRQSIVTIIEFSRIDSLDSMHVEGNHSAEEHTANH